MPINLQNNIDLSRLNTLRLTSSSRAFIVLNNQSQLPEICAALKHYHCFFILGGGSNLILPEIYDGLVIQNQLLGTNIKEVDSGYKLVTAMSGENWDNFVGYCCNNKAHGLENLSLIPGTVGASPVQNIGAYGVEVKDFIEYVTVYDWQTATVKDFTNAECDFSYRNSMFKNNPRYFIISVTFKLLTTPQLNTNYGDINKLLSEIANPTPSDLRNCVIATRKNKLPDPSVIGNVGSFFHNPIIDLETAEVLLTQHPNLPVYPVANPDKRKISAGWLIDNLGLKAYREGSLGIYPKQALVIVNYEPATQTEVLAFAKTIQDKVKAAYRIALNIEPLII